MRILFDHNVPVGVRLFLQNHEVRAVAEMQWPPQLANGELLEAAESARFDVLVTADHNIIHQQNLKRRKLEQIILGSNIWPIVRNYSAEIASAVGAARVGTLSFIEMPIPPKPSTPG